MAIEIQGIDELEERLEGFLKTEKIVNALGLGCAKIEESAKRKAPKGDGHLRRSITSRIEENGDEVIGIIFTPLEYAPYVEYGTGLFAEKGGRQDVPWSYQDDKGEWHTTSGMHPRPYMRPAFDENIEEVKRMLMEGLIND
jgi:HK97 gp10 family phage protein